MARWKTHQGTSRIWWHRRVALFYLVDVVWWIFWWEIVGKIVGILAMWRILLGYGDILGISLGMLLVVDIVWRCNLTLKLEDSLNWVPHSILLFKIWIPFFQKLKWPILRTTLLGSGNVGGVRLGKGMWWVGWEWLGDGVIFIGQLYPIVGFEGRITVIPPRIFMDFLYSPWSILCARELFNDSVRGIQLSQRLNGGTKHSHHICSSKSWNDVKVV